MRLSLKANTIFYFSSFLPQITDILGLDTDVIKRIFCTLNTRYNADI